MRDGATTRLPISLDLSFSASLFRNLPMLGRPIAMTRVFRWRWVGRSAVACLVLAALNAVAPAQAQAGCSHPWVRDAGISASLLDLGMLESGRYLLLSRAGISRSLESSRSMRRRSLFAVAGMAPDPDGSGLTPERPMG